MNEAPKETSETENPTSEPKEELVYESSTLPVLWMIVPALLLIAYAALNR